MEEKLENRDIIECVVQKIKTKLKKCLPPPIFRIKLEVFEPTVSPP